MGVVLRLTAICCLISAATTGAIDQPVILLIEVAGLLLLKLEVEVSGINEGIKRMTELMVEEEEDYSEVTHPPYEISSGDE